MYQGLYCVAIRDFKQAAELFLDTVSTFTSYELMDYKTFVTYTVYVSMIALDRPDLREKVRRARGSTAADWQSLNLFISRLKGMVVKAVCLFQVIKGAEILEALHSLPAVRQYLFSLYECRYAAFFQSLGKAGFCPSTLFQIIHNFCGVATV